MTKQALKDNLQNAAGVIVGLTVLKFTGLRFGKEHRGTRWFSTVAANLAADGVVVWFPFGAAA